MWEPQRGVVDHEAARQVEEDCSRPHPCELLLAEQAVVRDPPVDVQRHHVGLREQLVERAAATGVAQRQLVGRVVEQHRHAERLGQHGQLAADVAVADDAEPRPRTSWLPTADLSHRPACMSSSLTVSRRVRAMISDTASSTTLRVLLNGALKTATPRSAAAARSIWLVPMQKAPTASRSGAASRTSAVTVVLERMPRQLQPAKGERGRQLVGPQRPVQRSTS
jgi:hypothetical protein